MRLWVTVAVGKGGESSSGGKKKVEVECPGTSNVHAFVKRAVLALGLNAAVATTTATAAAASATMTSTSSASIAATATATTPLPSSASSSSSPTSSTSSAADDAAAKPPALLTYRLRFKGKILGASATLQSCRGLSNHSVVELVADRSRAPPVQIALQTPAGRLPAGSFPSSITLFELLSTVVDAGSLPPAALATASVNCAGRSVDAPKFPDTSLKDLGVFKGRALLRVRLDAVDPKATLRAHEDRQNRLTQLHEKAEKAKSKAEKPNAAAAEEVGDARSESNTAWVMVQGGRATDSKRGSDAAAVPADARLGGSSESDTAKPAQKKPALQAPTSKPASTPQERLASALAQLRKNHFDEDARETVGVLLKITDNIVRAPGNSKVRRLRFATRVFREKLQPRRGAVSFLKTLGFSAKGLRGSEDESFVLDEANESLAILMHAASLLREQANDLGMTDVSQQLPQRPKPRPQAVASVPFDPYKSNIMSVSVDGVQQAQSVSDSTRHSKLNREVEELQKKRDELLRKRKPVDRRIRVFTVAAAAAARQQQHEDHAMAVALAESEGETTPTDFSGGGGGSKNSRREDRDTSRDDTRLLMQVAKRKREAEQKRREQLSTRAMRDKERLAQERVYVETVLRVQFPDRVLVQAHFHASETIDSIKAVIDSVLDPESCTSVAYELFVTPPRKVLKPSDTLRTAGLASARAKIYLSWLVPPGDSADSSTPLPGAYLARQFREQLSETVTGDVLNPKVVAVQLVEGHQPPAVQSQKSTSSSASKSSKSSQAKSKNSGGAIPKWFTRR